MSQVNFNDQKFKNRDASSYDSVSSEFDRFTDLLSLPLAERMIYMADISPRERILDVGCGTGVVALNTARLMESPGKVVGVDLSDEMLKVAERKALESGLSDFTEFIRMDAEALEFEDCSFDTVLSLFALLHFPDPLQALKEMFRVLRPGGKLVVAVGSPPPLISLTGFVHRLKRLPDIVLKLQGRLLTAPGFLNSLVDTHLPMPDEPEETSLARDRTKMHSRVLMLVREVGFTALRSHWEGYQSCVETPQEFWDLQRTFSSIARKRIQNAPEEKVGVLFEEFLEKCREVQSRGGRLVYPYAAYFVSARRNAGINDWKKRKRGVNGIL